MQITNIFTYFVLFWSCLICILTSVNKWTTSCKLLMFFIVNVTLCPCLLYQTPKSCPNLYSITYRSMNGYLHNVIAPLSIGMANHCHILCGPIKQKRASEPHFFLHFVLCFLHFVIFLNFLSRHWKRNWGLFCRFSVVPYIQISLFENVYFSPPMCSLCYV